MRSMLSGSCRANAGAASASTNKSAMTPPPNQARVSRRKCPVARLTFASSQWISELRRRPGSLVFPSAMMPEVLLRRTTHPPFQYGGVIGDDPIDVAVAVASVRHVDRFERQSIPPGRLPDRRAKDDWRVQAEREDRRTARRFCEASEEGYPGRRESDRTLIDDERDDPALSERAWHAAHRLLVVNDRHPDALPRPREVAIEQRIGHVARDGVHAQPPRGQICTAELPV